MKLDCHKPDTHENLRLCVRGRGVGTHVFIFHVVLMHVYLTGAERLTPSHISFGFPNNLNDLIMQIVTVL